MHFSIVLLKDVAQMSSGPERAAAFLDRVLSWLLLCMTELSPAFVDGMMICPLRQWFLEVLQSPCSDFQSRTMPVFNAAWGLGDHRHPPKSNSDFHPFPLHTEIPPEISEYFHDIMRYSQLATLLWRALFWNWFTIFRCSFSQIVECLPRFSSVRLHLLKMVFLYWKNCSGMAWGA